MNSRSQVRSAARAALSAAALACLCLASALQKPGSGEGGKPSDFPSLTPFVDTYAWDRFLDLPFEDLDVDRKVRELFDEQNDYAARRGDALGSGAKSESPSARLEPRIEGERRFRLALVPRAMASLQPMWKSFKWTAKQFAAAQRIAKGLATIEGVPALAFSETDEASNRAELDKLITWFREQVARPEIYAAMILSFDEGPFAGLPCDAKAAAKLVESKKLDGATELRLSKIGDHRPEPWVLECVRAKTTTWSMILSDAPAQTLGDLRFDKDPATKLDEWGWRVVLDADKGRDGKYLVVYVGAAGEREFYYVRKPDKKKSSKQ
jgi:hypothetical protein